VDAIAARCTEVESGARNVDNILTNTALPAISRMLLESLVAGERPAAVVLDVGADGEFTYVVEAQKAPQLVAAT
jgi:type VI secretion system protein VasG